MLIGLPLVGVMLAGKPIAAYLAFPPETAFLTHAPFSWWVFCALTLAIIASVAPFLYCVIQFPASNRNVSVRATPFPSWGWLGIGIVAVAWWLAWNRFYWLGQFQEFTFTPLWLGYILVINALTWKRTGQCMLTHRTGYFLSLFPLSAAFWWFFEYLNRFVQNWYYVGAGELGAWEYFWQATLPFATVLPAVLGTRDWLATFPRLNDGLAHGWPMQLPQRKPIAWLVLLIAGVGLSGVGMWPDQLFSLLWLAPLLIITSLQVIFGEKSILDGPARGDWREMWCVALAALICGVFWELWNYKSLAHWEYSVPFVHRFEIFHMPVLGYAGYLPFGLECLAVASLLDRLWQARD